MFHLIVFIMFGLMVYGLWSLLEKLSRLDLSSTKHNKHPQRSPAKRSALTTTKRPTPRPQSNRPIRTQAQVEESAFTEVCRVRELREHLLGMAGGNEDLVDRLVESARKAKPFMGDEWYLEKVIADLHRDKGTQSRPRSTPSRHQVADFTPADAQSLNDFKQRTEQTRCRKLRQDLELLLRGDQEAAAGLIESLRQKQPLMGELWYLEKAIADIERDRYR